MLLLATVISTTMAIAMTFVAWRATRDERRRSDARVAALAEAIQEDDLLGEIRPHASPALFIAAPTAGAGSRWGVALAAGGLVVATLAALAIVFGGGDSSRSSASDAVTAPQPQPAPAAAPLPLELVALSHERDGDRLTIRGVVRNPAGGPERDRLAAVVSVFDPEGALVATGRAQVDSAALIAGGESPFSVTIASASDVGRYRVSFQSDGAVVVHVDKRNRS